jgi:hypothetical protein
MSLTAPDIPTDLIRQSYGCYISAQVPDILTVGQGVPVGLLRVAFKRKPQEGFQARFPSSRLPMYQWTHFGRPGLGILAPRCGPAAP